MVLVGASLVLLGAALVLVGASLVLTWHTGAGTPTPVEFVIEVHAEGSRGALVPDYDGNYTDFSAALSEFPVTVVNGSSYALAAFESMCRSDVLVRAAYVQLGGGVRVPSYSWGEV